MLENHGWRLADAHGLTKTQVARTSTSRALRKLT
jgi:hypothetical protein